MQHIDARMEYILQPLVDILVELNGVLATSTHTAQECGDRNPARVRLEADT